VTFCCIDIIIIRELIFYFHPCRVSVADGAHLTDFANELPHFEGLHLKNPTLFGEDTRVICCNRVFVFFVDFPCLFVL
jgi:hypothetical protein